MGRTLSEAEFERVKADVLASAPPNMSEATFNKWAPAQLAAAVAEAEARPAPVEGSAISRLASNYGAQVNPVTAVTGLASAVLHPIDTLGNIYQAQKGQLGQAVEAAQQGRYSEAVGHGAAGVLPLIGPAAAGAGEQIGRGDIAGGVGTGLGLITGVLAPGAVARRLPDVKVLPSLARAATDPVSEAVRWAQRQRIPVDLPTATGNKFLRGTQAIAGESIGGSVIGGRAREARAAALRATGEQLAERTALGIATTPETAGDAVRAGIERTRRARIGEQRAAYGELRKAEASPLHTEYVPEDLPRPVKERMQQDLGELPTGEEIQELRRINEELNAVPFQQGKLSRDAGAGFEAGDTTYSPRAAGAPVYHDILQAAPGTSKLTRGEVMRSIALALKTGRFTNAARGALAVAKERLTTAAGTYSDLSKPILPPEAGQIPTAMRLPVDLRPAKVGLRPLYEELQAVKESTGVLLGAKARIMGALQTIMTAGDHAPLSVVDRALSELKSLARASVGTSSEGATGAAVRQLEAQVQAAAERAGPTVVNALERGRAATRAKYVAQDLLKRLGKSEEGVGVYRKAIAPKDANRQLLQQLQQHAPEALPQIGRAFLDELLHKATAEGGFERAQGLLADWERLGPQTKRLLFRDSAHIKDLDNFFLIAKKLAENPNPSGSALTAAKGGELALLFTSPLGLPTTITTTAIAALLHSPRATQLLLQGLRLPVSARAARAAWAAQLTRAITEVAPTLAPAVTEDEPEPVAP